MLTIRACAKINLTLEALGKRADGYHEVVTVMQTIDLCDELTLEPAADVSLRCSEPALETDDNLALRAADLLRRHTGFEGGVEAYLMKSIPIAAGLGGGSSDAAAALVGLRRLWGLERAVADLRPLAAALGSDVAFFLSGGTALAEGRGDQVRSLPPMPTAHVTLLAPRVEIANKTAAMYARLTPESYTSGERSARLRSDAGGRDTAGPRCALQRVRKCGIRSGPSHRGGPPRHAGRGRAVGKADRQRPGYVYVRGLRGGGKRDRPAPA